MAKKKKRPPPPRTDAELVKRVQKHAPDILDADVDFDAIVDAVLMQEASPHKSKVEKDR